MSEYFIIGQCLSLECSLLQRQGAGARPRAWNHSVHFSIGEITTSEAKQNCGTNFDRYNYNQQPNTGPGTSTNNLVKMGVSHTKKHSSCLSILSVSFSQTFLPFYFTLCLSLSFGSGSLFLLYFRHTPVHTPSHISVPLSPISFLQCLSDTKITLLSISVVVHTNSSLLPCEGF